MKPYIIQRKNHIAWIEFPILSQFSELVHFSTLRMGGFSNHPQASLNMGFVRTDFTTKVIENRKLVAESLGIPIENMIFSRQTHSDHIAIVSAVDKGKGVFYKPTAIQDNDGYVVSEPLICPVVMTADCVPVFLYDPQNKIASVVHSGWRGTVQHIASKAVDIMVAKGSHVNNIVAAIGPSAGSCCYQVGEEVLEKFVSAYGTEAYRFFSSPKPPFTVNLWDAIRTSLIRSGLTPKHIAQTDLCTICNPHMFFSARNNKGMTGRMASGIMIKP
ncbi:MAG: peptidoglycan editing factor PgeF [Bacteroidales bacterium]|nr:peptidoglycan editing factor PgeF [Bacteroidales bacterium]